MYAYVVIATILKNKDVYINLLTHER